MMTLNICIESYGAVVHVMDSMLASGLQARPTQRLLAEHETRASGAAAQASTEPVMSAPASSQQFVSEVQAAVAGLGHDEAQAVWLVDVCAYSYDEAAHSSRTSRQIVADRVADGRRAIRSQLTAV